MHDHATPAAAHVEQAHAGLQSELAADQVELLLLCLLECRVSRGEDRAGVRHGRTEDPAVEAVGDVVVVVNGLGVASLRMTATGQARLLRRRRRALEREGCEGASQGELLARGDVRQVHRIEPAHGFIGRTDDLQVTAHVRAGQAELIRARREVLHGPGAAHVNGHGGISWAGG